MQRLGVHQIDASGTRDGTRFLRDDGVWAAMSGGAGGNVLLLDGGASVPVETAVDTIVFEKATSGTTAAAVAVVLLDAAETVPTATAPGTIIVRKN